MWKIMSSFIETTDSFFTSSGSWGVSYKEREGKSHGYGQRAVHMFSLYAVLLLSNLHFSISRYFYQNVLQRTCGMRNKEVTQHTKSGNLEPGG